MKWECACGFVNLPSSHECEACGWTRDYSERYKSGSLPKTTDEEQRRRDKITLIKEIKVFAILIVLNIFILFVTYNEDFIEWFLVVVLLSFTTLPIFIFLTARLLWRARKL